MSLNVIDIISKMANRQTNDGNFDDFIRMVVCVAEQGKKKSQLKIKSSSRKRREQARGNLEAIAVGGGFFDIPFQCIQPTFPDKTTQLATGK